MASTERNLAVAYRRHLERGCECPEWPACALHGASEFGGGEPDVCMAHGHLDVGRLAKAMREISLIPSQYRGPVAAWVPTAEALAREYAALREDTDE